MSKFDLHPAADQMTRLLAAIPDSALDGPTPCADTRLRVLVDHVGGLAMAFTAAAHKEVSELTATPPTPGSGALEPAWRDRIGADLAKLADAWDAPEAWDGMTRIGGGDLPGAVAGLVALDELIVHGWDIARATGQPFECDDAVADELAATIVQFRDGNDGEIPGLFGPVVAVPERAAPIDRVLGLAGRSPAWSAT